MSEERKYQSISRLSAFWIVLISTILGLFYGVTVILISPKIFDCSVVVEFKPKSAKEKVDHSTETAVMLSGETMKIVSRSLDLQEDWKIEQDTLIGILGGIVKAEPLEDSGFVELTVRHPSPDDAKNIANEIPRAYLKRLRDERGQKLRKESHDWMG